MSRGYTATKDQLLGRLGRVGGQVRGVSRTVEEDRYCIVVLTQISPAVLEKFALGLLDDHARHCMEGQREAPDDSQELVGAVVRLLRH